MVDVMIPNGHDKHTPLDLEASLSNEINRALADKSTPTPRPNHRSPTQSMQDFLTNGRRMLAEQQDMMVAEEARWRENRVKLQNEYTMKIRKMIREAEDALATLDLKYETKLAEDSRVLDSLRAVVNC